MYVYELGTLDFFKGMYRLNTFIKDCVFAEQNSPNMDFETFYFKSESVKRFLLRSFIAIKLNTDWEGDIRNSNCIAISSLPDPDRNDTYLILVLKQDNNGSTYVSSDVSLNYLTNIHKIFPNIKDNIKYSVGDLLESHDNALKLIDKIFSDVEQESKDDVVKNKDYILALLNNPANKEAVMNEIKKSDNKNYLDDFQKIG